MTADPITAGFSATYLLTDLEGPAGDDPRFQVLWAVPEGKAKAPWGKIIELD